MKENISILIADDHEHERAGLREILEPVEGLHVMGEADTAQLAVKIVQESRPDVVIMDLVWYGDYTAGIAAIEQIKQRVRETKIVAITVYPKLIEKARQAGADIALSKEFSKAQLVSAIRSAHQLPGFPMPSKVSVEADLLTNREKQVLALVAEGKTDQAIAFELGVAVGTAKKHIGNIMRKLNASNRTEAVAIAYEKKLL
jgi:NarL family two-component system response regulator LiaR